MNFKVYRYFVVLLAGLLLAGQGFSQKQAKIKRFATKVKTVNVAKQCVEQEKETQEPLFKVPNKEWKAPDWPTDGPLLYQATEKAKVNVPNRVKSESPEPVNTFLGLMDTYNSIPPDVMGAVGPNHVMTTLNTEVRVHDREGNPLMTTTLGLFWKSMPDHTRTFDPKIVYDPYADRWIFVTPSHPDNALSKLYIGVSQTSDPLGDWNMYWLNTDETDVTWFDFPTIGFNKKWIVVAGNMFGGDFYRTVFVFNKEDAYNGVDDLPYTRFATTKAFTLVPTFTYDPTLEDVYLIAAADGNDNGQGTIKKFVIKGAVDDPQFIYQGKIVVPDPWANSAGYAGNFLPQAGTDAKINSVDSRMVNTVYRNGKIWAVHHIFLPAENPQRAAVQWWVIDTNGVVLERGRIEDPTNNYSFAFPAIAVNKYEDVMIGHGVFSEDQYASAGYSYKNHTDPEGTVRTYFQYKDGLAPYYKTYGGSRNRWGDYSATSLDPVGQSDFWVVQEYAETPANTWSTWWAYVKVAFVPEADFMTENRVVPTGEEISFKDLTLGIPSQWKWYFEGAEPSFSSDQNPTGIHYNSEGVFDVKLIVTNDLGSDTILKENYITVSSTVLPKVDFDVDKVAVCTDEPVAFHDSTLFMPRAWEWDFTPSSVTFHEGTDQFTQNPVVSFDQPGSYTVKLTASNLNGSADTVKFDLIVSGGFKPYFHENFESGFEKNYWEIEDVEPENEYGRTWELADVGFYSDHSAMIRFTDYIYWGHRDRLISPVFNFDGMSNAVLEFKHAYAKRFDDASDSLFVLISEDCGENWQRIAAFGDDGYGSFATSEQTDTTKFWKPASAADWCGQGYGSACVSVDLTPWVGKSNIRIAFESFNFFGNALYLDNVTIEQHTGVTEQPSSLEKDLLIFPNPAKNFVTFSWAEEKEVSAMEIYTMSGKMWRKFDLSGEHTGKWSVNVSGWPKGVYLITLKGNVNKTIDKLIVY